MNRVIAAVLSTTVALAGAAQAERGTTGLTLAPNGGNAARGGGSALHRSGTRRADHWLLAAAENLRQNRMIGIIIGVPAPMSFFPFGGTKASFFGDIKVHGSASARSRQYRPTSVVV